MQNHNSKQKELLKSPSSLGNRQSIIQLQHQMSDLQQKSFFLSEAEDPEPEEIQDFLYKIQKIKDEDIRNSFNNQTRKSTRLQYQQIIVVEQQNDLQSINGGKESVILEHIQFDTDSNPKAIEQQEQDEQIIEHVDYPRINYLDVKQPKWMSKQDESMQEDLESIDYKINTNRLSKNTCSGPQRNLLPVPNKLTRSHRTEYINNLQYHNQIVAQTNKNRLLVPYPKNNKIDKNSDVDQIIDKWANENHSESIPSNKNKEHQNKCKIKQYNSLENQEFGYIQHYPSFSDQYDEENIFNKNKPKESIQINNKIKHHLDSGTELKTQYLEQSYQTQQNERQIQEYKMKIQELVIESQKGRYKNAMEKKQMIKIKQMIIVKDNQINKLQANQKETAKIIADIQNKKKEEVEKYVKKIEQFQKKIDNQNSTIKQYKQKNNQLQQQQAKSSNQYQKNLQLIKSKTLLQKNEDPMIHKQCKLQIEQLQECIFDIKQQLSGIDLQVQKRVKEIIQDIEMNITEKISQQYQIVIKNFKQESQQLQEIIRTMEIQKDNQFQEYRQKNNELYKRQIQINYRSGQLQNKEKQLRKYENDLKNKEIKINMMNESLAERKVSDYQKIKENYFSPKIQTKSNGLYSVNSYQIELNNPGNNHRIFQSFSRNRQSFLNNNSKPHVSHQDFGQEVKRSRKSINKYNKDFHKSPTRLSKDLSFNKFRQTQNEPHNMSMPFSSHDDKMMRKEPIMKRQSQNNELLNINNKIQQLRMEINKELGSIH